MFKVLSVKYDPLLLESLFNSFSREGNDYIFVKDFLQEAHRLQSHENASENRAKKEAALARAIRRY